MIQPQRTGFDTESGRDVFHACLPSLAAEFDLRVFAGRRFACLLAMGATGIPAREIGALCIRLLDAGCVYFCAWGPDCGRVHDIMDEEIVGENPPETSRGDVMTTWHDGEPLADAVEFLLTSTNDGGLALVLAVNVDVLRRFGKSVMIGFHGLFR